MGIVKSFFSRVGRKGNEIGLAVVVPETAAQLVMLTPDASGIATYQLRRFNAAKEAEDYLDSTLRGDIREGTVMFWGLTNFPSAGADLDGEVEPVVLIRDASREGLVYTFSFVDLGSAYEFIRREMTGGLQLGQTAVYWAIRAQATVNFWGEANVTPDRPSVGSSAPLAARPVSEAVEAAPEAVLPTPDDEASDGPAAKAIDGANILNIIDILEARGLRPRSHATPTADETESEPDSSETGGHALEDDGTEPSHEEVLHLHLSDVFGGSRGAPTELGELRRPEEHDAHGNGVEAAVNGGELHDEPVSGIAVAWDNIGHAIDEAIDAFVARRVGATIAWRRIARALAAAARVRMIVTWRVITKAIAAAAALQAARERAAGMAWSNAGRALRVAAEAQSGRRAMRLAWMNISWTLEEAVYAARLEQKAASRRAWHRVTCALAEAAEAFAAKDPAAGEQSAAENAIGTWRCRESGRFTEKKGPFSSFDSPPGRF